MLNTLMPANVSGKIKIKEESKQKDGKSLRWTQSSSSLLENISKRLLLSFLRLEKVGSGIFAATWFKFSVKPKKSRNPLY